MCLLFDYPFVLAVLEILANVTDSISKKTLQCLYSLTKIALKLVKLLKGNFNQYSPLSLRVGKTPKSNEAFPSEIPCFGQTLTSSDNAIPECIAISSVKPVHPRELIIHIF